MRQTMSKLVLAVMAVAALLLVFGCDLGMNQGGTGSLAIGLGSSSRNLVWEPGLDMGITSYTISGTGPTDGDSFEVSGHTGGLFTQDGLVVGNWTITVDGYNTDEEKIATAVADVVITRNATSAASMVLRPLEGTGTLSVNMSWTDSNGLLTNPTATVVIRDEEGIDIATISEPAALTISGQTATGTVTDLPTGWYEVTVRLSDGITTAWDGVFVLRVVKGQTTTGTVTIPEEQIHIGTGTGTVAITIVEDMDDPLAVGFSGMPDLVEAGGTITLTSTGTYSGNEQYRWYVNGLRQTGETAASFSYIFDEEGTFMVSLLVLDGGALGGYGESVSVGGEAVVVYAVGEIGPAGGYVFYENPNFATDVWRYLEAAPADIEGFKVWGGDGTSVGSSDTGMGTGESNTSKIVAAFDDGDYAAKVCADLVVTKGGVTYDDWFLPSRYELNEMFWNVYFLYPDGFSPGNYWSSSEDNAYDAWAQDFYDGTMDASSQSKHYEFRVRPVRAF
jgi:hypothetical protein